MAREYNPRTKTAIEGTEKEYMDVETGEIITTVQTKVIHYGQSKFFRIIKGEFFKAMSALDGSSMKVALYIVDNCSHENVFYGTYKDLEQALSFSNKTIIVAMQKIQEHDIIRMIHKTQWMFNPKLAISCYDESVPYITHKYFSLRSYTEKQEQKKTRKENENAD